MSRSILSPSEMAAWFEGTHRRARITVPILTLAQDYIDEGAAAGVRGDIAFAQSILETGSFYFPDGGQLTPQDNNFAGMDACDSCAHGRAFPDARTGVRAQVQQLRVYADPTVTNASFNPPPVVANLDQHSLKGRVPTWNGLTHTWATADAYGDRILADLRADARLAHRPRRHLTAARSRRPGRRRGTLPVDVRSRRASSVRRRCRRSASRGTRGSAGSSPPSSR